MNNFIVAAALSVSLLLASCASERIVVVTATAEPTLEPAPTARPTLIPTPIATPTIEPSPTPALLLKRALDYAPTEADMPRSCMAYPVASGSMKQDQFDAYRSTFLCENFAGSGMEGNLSALIVVLPNESLAKRAFASYTADSKAVKTLLEFPSDPSLPSDPKIEKVNINISADDSASYFTNASILGQSTVVIREKNLLAILLLKGAYVSEESKDLFMREAEYFAQAFLEKAR